jgi:hypothetical protein
MHKALLISATLLTAAAGGAPAAIKTSQDEGAETPNIPAAPVAEETRNAAEDFVRRFFKAYDARDVAAAGALLAPEMKFVAIDARERDVAALLEDAGAGSHSAAPKRELGNFEVIGAGPLTVVTFEDRVASRKAGASLRHRETWILKPTPAGLRAVRAVDSIKGANIDPHYVPPKIIAPDEVKLSAQDQPAADFLARFFDAYLGRRPDEMRSMFVPGSRFTLPNGEESSVDEMAKRQTGPAPPHKYPRPKNGGHFLDHYEIQHVGSAMIVVFDHHVTDWTAGHPERESLAYRETWVLEETPAGLRDVWAALAVYGNAPPR